MSSTSSEYGSLNNFYHPHCHSSVLTLSEWPRPSDEIVLTFQIKSNAQQMSKYNRYSFLLWENEPLNETFNPLWLPMAPNEIYPDIKSHLNHFLVPTPLVTDHKGWGTHVIVSLWYWFIRCSLLSGENPPIGTLWLV